jgi:hypothetical protein
MAHWEEEEDVSKSKVKVPKELRKVVREAQKQGIKIRRTNNNHFVAIPRDRNMPLQHISCTPSDYRGMKNALALLKRAGYNPAA